MKNEKSCGTIIFNNDCVLVIKQNSGFYGFPKGHVEGNETDTMTAYRETLEEVGLEVSIDSSKKFSISYLIGDNILKEAIYFIAFVKGNNRIVIQEEELSSACFVPIDDVYDMLSFDNLKELWIDALNYYKEKYNS